MNKAHLQPYYPNWIDDDALTFRGTRLPNNARYDGSKYVLDSFAFGYVDNQPDNNEAAKLKIDWAVKADGTPANLKAIHFVKVQTGLLQQCGAIGETSTEVAGAEDLHPNMPMRVEGVESVQVQTAKIVRGGQIYIVRDSEIFTLYGTKIH